MFWLFLDPCFEWAGSARADRHRLRSGPGDQSADAQEEVAVGHRGEKETRPREEPQYRPAVPRLGRR